MNDPAEDEPAITTSMLATWGSGRASTDAEDPAPADWIVLLVVLGLPALLVLGSLVLALTR